MYYSHKLNGPGLTYEIAINLTESKVVWLNGPFPAGNTDLVMFRKENGLKSRLVDGMYLVGDRGYKGEDQVLLPNSLDEEAIKKFKKRASARHESFNSKIKKFSILSECYRHPIDLHPVVFEAICVLTQYTMEIESPLFEI